MASCKPLMKDGLEDGKTIICEWNNSLHHDNDGNVIGVISLGLDISDRKQADEEREVLIVKLREAISNIKTHKVYAPDLCFMQKDT
jgi:hypothetical protein